MIRNMDRGTDDHCGASCRVRRSGGLEEKSKIAASEPPQDRHKKSTFDVAHGRGRCAKNDGISARWCEDTTNE